MLCIFILLWQLSYAQTLIRGQVSLEEGSSSTKGLTVRAIHSLTNTSTDQNGNFEILVNLPDTLVFRGVGVHEEKVYLESERFVKIALSNVNKILEEVIVYDGYLAQDRASVTGAYSTVDSTVLSRNISSNILSRLDGNLSSLQFVQPPGVREGGGAPSLRVRGLSTIEGNTAPLIVVDNFPFDGDINALNPNDIETVTLLKDAAAAAIWGARAGNGVIVITTKKATRGQPLQINYQHSTAITGKPDLYRNRNFLPSREQIEFDRIGYERGWYNINDWTLLSPVTELQIALDDNHISEAEFNRIIEDYESKDIRADAERYLYRKPLNIQNHVDIQGGSARNRYYFSVGHFVDEDNIIGNSNKRIGIRLNEEYKIADWLELQSSVNYSSIRSTNNGLGISDLDSEGTGVSSVFPYSYLSLATDAGEPLSIPKKFRTHYIDGAEENGLLDWRFYPLKERELANNFGTQDILNIDVGLSGMIGSSITWQAKYFHLTEKGESTIEHHKESYFVRDLVNRFTQPDGQQVIPDNGIVDGTNSKRQSNSGRFQLRYTDQWGEFNTNAIGGAEIRQSIYSANPGYRLYDFDPEFLLGNALLDYTAYHQVRPTGGYERIPMGATSFQHLTDRFLSYYLNIYQSYKQKYHLSASSRWDASNIFGVETNKKGVPLWSVGGAWNIDKENFFNVSWVDMLKVRTSYGVSGNVNNIESAYPTAFYTSDILTQLPYAMISSLGNPLLRWEKVATYNAGLDFSLFSGRLSGNIDHYIKKGTDLIGPRILAGSTGIYAGDFAHNILNRINYAGMTTRGTDVQLDGMLMDAAVRWSTTLIVNRASNIIDTYNSPENIPIQRYLGVNNVPVSGKSLDAMFALPWRGLSPEDGSPLVIVDDDLGTDYSTYLNRLAVDDLILKGSAVPIWTGSMRHNVSWKNLDVSLMLTWQGNFYFRKPSISYNSLINSSGGNVDFNQRWRQPGDEQYTNVPSIPEGVDQNRDFIYLQSEPLLTRGDHVRLQELYLSYRLGNIKSIKNLAVSFFARDLGILWKKNDDGIDPKYAYAVYPPSATYSLGLNFKF